MSDQRTAILLIHCPDQKGLVRAVTDFIFQQGGNITYLDQYTDLQDRVFFMRVEWDLAEFALKDDQIQTIFQSQIAEKFQMKGSIHFSDQILRMGILVSKSSHCLYDILSRVQAKEWNVTIPLIVSNHNIHAEVAKRFGIPFHHLPVTQREKKGQEEKVINVLKENKVDVVVLARYMQIMTENFINQFPLQTINIHHSFLPAFPGGHPYHSAHARGVKIIGATSHYITPELDAGPIIEQDVVRVDHKDTVADMTRKGRDLEKIVLSRAIWKHLQRKILVYKNRTVVFD